MESNSTNQGPEAETLKARSEDRASTATTPSSPAATNPVPTKKPARRSYRPSHKATFIGLAVVIAILAVNAAVIGLVLKKQAKKESLAIKGQVSISSEDLNKLGINRGTVGDTSVILNVSPDTQFKGKLMVAGNTILSGTLAVNNKLTGADGNFTQLEAGNTALSQLNVNGNSTLSTLNLRQQLVVAGSTQLQGPVTLNQLLTVANSVNISGNLAVGGTLTVSTFSARSLTSTSTLTIGGHIITNGPSPSVGAGGAALGSNGTVGISGNDAAGLISINIGVGASGGTLATVTFKNSYSVNPKVVITPVGVGGTFYIASLSTSGFSVAVSGGLPAGGYRINYIAVQ
jgi:hypothetical protein